MTRPQSASEAFVASLPDATRARFEPVFSPLVEIVPLPLTVTINAHDSAVFSSANGVRAAPDGQGRIAYCIGSATTKVAQDRGWDARQMGTDADGLVKNLRSVAPENNLLHLSGVHTRGDVAGRLAKAGLNIKNIAVYDQRLCPLTPEASQIIATAAQVVVPLFSPRTAAQFLKVTPNTASVHAVALSAAIAAVLPADALASLTIATHPDAQSMGAALSHVA
ncbi:uroporphyrinogen-III synthase [Tateyamaria armeniaca]|uniref:Uroporphyrinogen-III synthase n=1 Tax=Tateyamaria armeniaca TaxID=2518930 RepID=A0ABW8UUS2_9RHOB